MPKRIDTLYIKMFVQALPERPKLLLLFKLNLI